MVFDLTIGFSRHGRPDVAEANAERLLDAFERSVPETAPVVDADLNSGVLSVTFSVKAENAERALEEGRPIFATGAAASGLAPVEVIRIEVRPSGVEATPLAHV